MTVASIVAAHRAGTASPEDTVARSFARIRAHDDPAVFISLRAEADALAEARTLDAGRPTRTPLYGMPFAVKDNIDVAGLPTTAGLPGLRLLAVAAMRPRWRGCARPAPSSSARPISISSPPAWSACARPTACRATLFDPALIPGGSSSGSAVAVAAGLVPLALGTDTAGSGRVPAGLNNIVGLKPSLGLISTAGVVPACRTLDCVSVFALTVDDAFAALAAMAGPDPPIRIRARVRSAGSAPCRPASARRADARPAAVLRRRGVRNGL